MSDDHAHGGFAPTKWLRTSGLEKNLAGEAPGTGQLVSTMRAFIDGGGKYTDAIGAILNVLADRVRMAGRQASELDAGGDPQAAALLETEANGLAGLETALSAAANVAHVIEYDEALVVEEDGESEPEEAPMAANARNKQPFYHRMEVLFTATQDVSSEANSHDFLVQLAGFLRRALGPVIKDSVQMDSLVDAEPGDPSDLMMANARRSSREEAPALSSEERSALRAYASKHGRDWKDDLANEWMRASAPPVLHRLRNTHGPSWLHSFDLRSER